jgi:hypothetical protein
MRKITGFLIVILILTSNSLAAPAPTPSPTPVAAPQVLSFKDWKSSRIDESQRVIDKMSAEAIGSTKASQAAMVAGKPGRAAKLQQALQNAEIAQELTVNDYFVLYLSQFHTKDAFVEAAKRLSPEELAELMMAYQKALISASPDMSNPMISKAK